jgi:hypothetical protein
MIATIWEKFSAFWAVYGPWVATSLIPTLITGLTLSPKTAGAASWIEKIWAKVKTVLNMLSLATHKDQAGTFQLPLKIGKVLKKDVGPAAILVIAILTSTITVNTGCSWLKSEGKAVGSVVYDCSKKAVMDKIEDLWPTVLVILGSGAANWEMQLLALAKEFGEEALACVVEYAAGKLEGAATVSNMDDPENPYVPALTKARQYQLAHHWTYADK